MGRGSGRDKGGTGPSPGAQRLSSALDTASWEPWTTDGAEAGSLASILPFILPGVREYDCVILMQCFPNSFCSQNIWPTGFSEAGPRSHWSKARCRRYHLVTLWWPKYLVTLKSLPHPQNPAFDLSDSLFPYQCCKKQDLGKAALIQLPEPAERSELWTWALNMGSWIHYFLALNPWASCFNRLVPTCCLVRLSECLPYARPAVSVPTTLSPLPHRGPVGAEQVTEVRCLAQWWCQ